MGFLDQEGMTHFWGKVRDALAGKQDKLAPDESITLEGGAISVSLPTKAVSQAEYDALSDETKRSSLFIITDANPSGDSGCGAPQNIYSTEETRIGTWIDGKPIYRRIYTGVMPGSGANWHTLDNRISNLETLVHLYGTAGEGTGTAFPIPYTGTSTIQSAYGLNSVSSTGGVMLYTQNTIVANKPYHIIIEYTKTTDEAVSQ